jgi:hypothetical protein
MKSETIHVNACGEVRNASTAAGFYLEDDHGRWIEARLVDGVLKVDYGVPLSPPTLDEFVATAPRHRPVTCDLFGPEWTVSGDVPPRQLISKPCPVAYSDPAPQGIRTIAELMDATHAMWDHGHPTTEELIAATKPQRCIWPDCGHDTNQSNPDSRCNGAHCPKPGDGS